MSTVSKIGRNSSAEATTERATISVAATKTCFIKVPFHHERGEKAGEFEAGRLYAILSRIKSFDKAATQPDVKRPTLRVRDRGLICPPGSYLRLNNLSKVSFSHRTLSRLIDSGRALLNC